MKNTAKIIFIVSLLFLANVTFAQKGRKAKMEHNGHGRDGKSLEKMAKVLELTPEQEIKMAPILKEMKAKADSFKNVEDKKAKRAEMKDFMEQKRGEIKAILTEKQLEKFEQLRKENKKKRKGKHGKRY